MTAGWIRARAGDFRLEFAWRVEPRSVLVLFGPSGAGKSMALSTIAGLLKPEDGEVTIGERLVYSKARGVNLPPHLRRCGYVPQDWLLFPHLDVAGNVAYGLRDKRKGRVLDLLSMLGLEGLERRRVWELSGGQRQRVALARALAPGPEVLLLDEPFSALDLEARRSTREQVLKVLREAGLPVVLVTHDREEALALGDAVQVLDQGKCIAEGPPLRVLGHPPRERVARLVGVENLLRLTVNNASATDGRLTCSRAGLTLEAPYTDANEGEEVTVGLRADDVLLASERPKGLSARNIWKGRVVSVRPTGALYEVTLDCGLPLKSHVTRGAAEALGIQPGVELWAVVKASSCFIARE